MPYRPGAYLRLQAAGSKGGDFVFSAGYPATAADAPLRVAYGHVQVGAVVRHNRVAGAAEPAAAQVEATAQLRANEVASWLNNRMASARFARSSQVFADLYLRGPVTLELAVDEARFRTRFVPD